ncbi:retrovirus-related Pol polyprotein from transposon 17.6 [Trichonephila clavipes]|nr:retrovirus-related Pol polyprotein from transposon 17.6 [Trichonephila clavipes]
MCIGQAEPLNEGHLCYFRHIGLLDDHQEIGVTDELFVNDVINIRTTRKFSGLFTKTDKSTAAKTNVKHRIFTGDHAPINQRAYRVRRLKDASFMKRFRKCLMKRHEKDVYPLPRIDDTLDCLKGAKFFSSMDLRSGYWQIEIDEADERRHLLPPSLYEFKVMPFGLHDIIVFSETFEDHLIRLRLVLKCLQEAGLKLNSKKCLFAAQEVKILGHHVSSNGVRPDPDKIKASLLKSGVEFHWGPEEVEAFNSLKKALTSDPVLGMYDERASTEIHTDASGTLKKPKRIIPPQKGNVLPSYGLPTNSAVHIGKHFTVVTDHHSAVLAHEFKDPSGRLARWALRLQEHDFDVKYKTGKKHSDADALSRNPVEEETKHQTNF